MEQTTPSIFLFSKDNLFFHYSNFQSDLDGAIQAEKVFRFVGSFFVKDLTNDYVSEIKIIPPPKKGGLTGFFSKAPPVKNEDLNKVLIEIKKGNSMIATGR